MLKPSMMSGARWRDSRRLGLLSMLLSAAAAFALAAPGFRFAYLFDDYNFLIRTLHFRLSMLLPDPGSVLYRPISRELYFAALNTLFPDSPVAGHIINAVLLASIVVLGATLVTRLAGRRAGAVAAVLLAGLSPWPVLVAWISGSQDLFAILFLLLALHLEVHRRGVLSLLAFIAAILSKETAIFAAPALVMARWLGSRSRRELHLSLVRCLVTLCVWALIHPGIRVLLALRGASPPGGYIGFDNPSRWSYLAKSIPVLLNLPLTGLPTPWPHELLWSLGLAAAPLMVALWTLPDHVSRIGGNCGHQDGIARRNEVEVFGIILAVPPLLFTSLLVQHWAPYYACFAGIGVIIAGAPFLASRRDRTLVPLLLIYLLGGFWSRGIELKAGLPTERGLAPAGTALRHLEHEFKQVAPGLPPSCTVYVGIMATGAQSIYIHLHDFQALRVWYRDGGIQTLRPELRVNSSSPEALLGVEPDLDVLSIDPDNLSVRTSSASAPPRQDCRNVLTSYAIGVATSGDYQRAVDILSRLSRPGSWDHVADLRIAETLLITGGQRQEATKLVDGLPQFPPQVAINHVGLMLTIPTRGLEFDDAAIEAFGLPRNDPRVYRTLMRGLLELGYDEPAVRMARRLLRLRPGDEEGEESLLKAEDRIRQAAFRIMPKIDTIRFPWE